MNKTTIALLAGALLATAGCRWGGIRGNGHIVTDNRPVEDFSEIEADGGFKIEWRKGAPSLSITTDENLLSHITSANIDHRLRLHSSGNLWPTHHVVVAISSPNRAGAKLSGASDMKAYQLSAPQFAIQGSGASDITLDGTVDQLIAELTGASDVKAKDLQTKIAEISATGAADVTISVSETLRVSITGAGDVKYYGTPKTIEKHITGAGSIRHKD
jgi:hypothetical protein